jgi:hypothetical protein
MTMLGEHQEGWFNMSEIVQCGICGKSFNKRFVNSHKRLAHAKKPNPGSSAKTEREVMEEILHLYANLSDEKRKELQIRLKSPASAR